MNDPKILIGSKFVEGVLPFIHAADHSIDIIIYHFQLYSLQKNHPVSRLVSALAIAVARGVRVRVIMSNDNVMAQLRELGFSTRRLYSDKLVHAKMMLIDGSKLVVGSHNYTQSAFTNNLEISVAFDLPPSDDTLQRYFNGLWGL